MEYHEICREIQSCNEGCFRDRYEDYIYKGKQYSKEFFCSIRPMASVPLTPKVLLISQNPSLQAWINAGSHSELPDAGLISSNNKFFLNDLLPAFGIGAFDIELFRQTVAWIHLANCYTWFSLKKNKKGKIIRQDKTPSNPEINNCIIHHQWFSRLLQMESVQLIVPMGEPALSLFVHLKNGEYTEKMKSNTFYTVDENPNKIILPIFHQSKGNRIFNDYECQKANKKAIEILALAYKELT